MIYVKYLLSGSTFVEQTEISSSAHSSPATFCFCFVLFVFRRERGAQSHFRINALEDRDDSEDYLYWQKYASLLHPKKEMLWDSLIQALEKYQ